MRTIGVVTVGRSDYGIYFPLLKKIVGDPDLKLHLIATGMHLSSEFGNTINMIKDDGFEIGDRIEMLLASDTQESISKSMGLGIIGFSQSYARFRPDILVVLGDRFEMFTAALAALPFNIPVAHIHGGELTLGAMDDALRHAMTKLCHLHFVSTEEYGRRVAQLGEEAWRITVTGAPALDNLPAIKLYNRKELEILFDIRLEPAPLLVTYHPVTLELDQLEMQAENLLAALEESALPLIFTLPNADTGSRLLIEKMRQFINAHPAAHMIENMGTKAYFSMMANTAAMVGNSSSGIIEAASFKLPVVNIGTRQEGRIRGKNVIDVGYSKREILAGILRATSVEFHQEIKDMKNPYGEGNASEKIIERLKSVTIDNKLLQKRFIDLPSLNKEIN